MLTGEKPEVNAEVAARLAGYGHEDFTSYVAWACERALERGMLPHTNIGAISKGDLARLREVTASQGLMLESVNPDLVVHQGSPTKHPAVRLDTIRAAGELRIPFTSGILVGIGESPEERIDVAGGARGGARRVRPPAGGDPPELRAPPALLRRGAGGDRGRGAKPTSDQRRATSGRDAAVGHRRSRSTTCATLVRECKRLMPDVGIQIPPNLSDWWLPLVEEGATDLGGLSANGDHISPEHPFPSPHRMRKLLQPKGYALTERLCVYPQYMDSEWLEQGVLDVIKLKYWSFIPRRGSGRREDRVDPARPGGAGAIERARAGERLDAGGADGDVRRDAARGDRGHAAGGRRAAARAGRRRGHVRRQPQHQRVEHLRRRMRLLRLRPGQALAGRLRARRGRVRPARGGGRRVRRDRDLHAVRASIPTGRSRTTRAGCGSRRRWRRRSTCTRTRRWRWTTWPATCRWTRRSRG